MNPTEKVEVVAYLLDRVRPVSPGLYVLYVQDQKISFARDTGHTRELPVIARLTSKDVNEGPTVRQWDNIAARLATLLEQGVL